MTQHLQQILDATPLGRHAVIIDGAGWHTFDTAAEFQNITLIKLPPYSPELNPIEQVWQWLRQRHLSNRKFRNYEDILVACSDAWNSFRNNIETVKSICTRDWIKLT